MLTSILLLLLGFLVGWALLETGKHWPRPTAKAVAVLGLTTAALAAFNGVEGRIWIAAWNGVCTIFAFRWWADLRSKVMENEVERIMES